MNTLPSIDGFSAHQLKFTTTHTFMKQGSTQDIDLNKFHKNLLLSKERQQDLAMQREDVINPTHLLYEIFNKEFLFSFNYMIHPIIGKYIGYSKKYESLTISIFDEKNIVQAIAIRRAKDIAGETLKWKTYGQKTFIPYKINDDFIFLASGMSELLLLEMLKVSYILLQSDSIFRHISHDIIDQVTGRYIIVLKENDNSFDELIIKLKPIFHASTIIIIDFEDMLNMPLKKGFDVVDFANYIKDIHLFEKMIENQITAYIKERK